MATVTPSPRPERTLDSIAADLLDRSARAGRCFLGSVMHEVLHAQIDALLDEWEAAR